MDDSRVYTDIIRPNHRQFSWRASGAYVKAREIVRGECLNLLDVCGRQTRSIRTDDLSLRSGTCTKRNCEQKNRYAHEI